MATEPTETERLLAGRPSAGPASAVSPSSHETAEEHAAERRADKAAYLTEKLREREASEEEEGS